MNKPYYPNIEAERARNGLTVEDLTNALHVSRKTYYNWTNKGHIPLSKLKRMAEMFDVAIDYLIETDEPAAHATGEVCSEVSGSP